MRCGPAAIRTCGSSRSCDCWRCPLYQGAPTYQSYLIRSKGDTTQSVVGLMCAARCSRTRIRCRTRDGWWRKASSPQLGIGPRDFKRTFFAHGHRNVAEAVAARLAQAGSIDGYVWETMRKQGMSAALQTEVDLEVALPRVPAHGGCARREPPETRSSCRTRLLAMARDEAGRELLKTLNLDGFIAGSPACSIRSESWRAAFPTSGVSA